MKRAGQFGRPKRRRSPRVRVKGRVKGAGGGRVELRLERRAPRTDAGTDRRWTIVRAAARVSGNTLRVRKDGTFRTRITMRRKGHWRLRASYVGNHASYPSRSHYTRFST